MFRLKLPVRHVRLFCCACALLFSAPLLAADMNKVLHTYFPNSESSFDPATAFEANTISINENLFDPLLRYNYLVRPLRLEGNTAEGMPQVSADGLTYTIKIKPGIYFTPDPVFKGVKRELVAQDYVYSFMRLYDPVLKSPWSFLFEGVLLGDEALKKNFSYDTRIPGLQALDRYTLQLRLKAPNANLPNLLAMPATAALAREVIEAHKANPGNHPVGTGPYLLKEWQHSNRIVLAANPDFRPETYTWQPGEQLADAQIAEKLKGRRLPLIGQVEVKIMEEHQSVVLAFLNQQLDLAEQIPEQLTKMLVGPDRKIRPELGARGVVLHLNPRMQTDYAWFNMQDPVVGGYSKEKIALRRAISMAYDQEEDIRVHSHGLAIPAVSLLPPNLPGYDPDMKPLRRFDVGFANKLLDRFGYGKRDAEGFRMTPQGKPLAIVMHSRANATGRVYDERWRKTMQSIGIRISFKSDKYTEIIKASRLGQVQMFEFGWVADYPDSSNFFQLLYGPNIGISNDPRFDLPEYNKLYEAILKLPNGPERQRIHAQMIRLIDVYMPMMVRLHRLTVDVRHSWLQNYVKPTVDNTAWRYLDIDADVRAKSK
ncbi:ABC transporter substrate-binding protein [Massilia sp. W12]|uniref:ABC transporter substrate-binding protein n=1 Tax=Massilia sp. W12 TaxID=3126507 RepID=UPI0030CF4E68